MSGLARRCACGAENALDARCCDRCGAPLSGAEGFSAGGAVVAARPLASAPGSACGGAPFPSDVAACGSAAVPAPAAARAVFVGRGADCVLRLASDTVSERHAVVFESGGVLFVQDLGSRNGTFLDGARVTRAVPWNGAATLRCGGGAVSLAAARAALAAGAPAAVVGRAPECTDVVPDPSVSGFHALLAACGRELWAVDLGAANGLFAGRGGRPIVAAPIDPRGTLMLGSFPFDAAPVARRLGAAPGRSSGARRTTRPLILGRSADCDVVFDFPQVSSRHARLTKRVDGSTLVEDLESANGTFVDGARVVGSTVVPAGRSFRLGLGSHEVSLGADAASATERPADGAVRVDAIGLKGTATRGGRPLVTVDGVSLSFGPAEMVGLLGPSGSGKTSLLLILAGYDVPAAGRVLVGGEDLHLHAERFRGLVGFVPQDDVVPRELTPREALTYAARLRLPDETGDEEIARRVARVLAALDLEECADSRIGTVEEKVLSGGQRKRVNMALEMITDPPLLLLDEPLSGLSSRDAAAVAALLRRLSDAGKTILMTLHQPSADVFELLDQAAVMARGGKLVYAGPPDGAYEFFETRGEHPDRVMERLETRPPDEWRARFAASSWGGALADRVVEVAGAAPRTTTAPPAPRRASRLRQFGTLAARYVIAKSRDRLNLLVVAAQAPIVGLLLALLFHDARENPLRRATPLFVLAVALVFFGCFNACRELVRERALFRRERMAGLRIGPYLLSKFFVLGGAGLAQAALLQLFVAWWMGLAGDPFVVFAVLGATVLAATAIGLAVSALVRSPEAAMAVVPILLIPQIVLSGFLVGLDDPGKGYVRPLSAPMPTRWAVEGLFDAERAGLERARAAAGPATFDCFGGAIAALGGEEKSLVCSNPEALAGLERIERLAPKSPVPFDCAPVAWKYRYEVCQGYAVNGASMDLVVLAAFLAAGLGVAAASLARRRMTA